MTPSAAHTAVVPLPDGTVPLQGQRLIVTRMRALQLDDAGNPTGHTVEIPVPTGAVITRDPYR